MLTYYCDGCGAQLSRNELRYRVHIDVRAAYEELEIGLADLVRDHRVEMLELIERLKDKSAQEIEETVYKRFDLDLCPRCQRAYLQNPLRFHPEQGAPEDGIDMDGFLRSLGMGAPRRTPPSDTKDE
ncbi:MAG TPA: hypothetical protein PLO62_12850 [Candidatus Hydrogenedentes bacterium]|nr:hypothetical protein [Candidatus Hydrogenedentota bacterium]HOS04104.1 hypothetical protein [Candidatus Hydrogenedentota bacterium]